MSGSQQEYRDGVLPPSVTARVAVEAGVGMGWERYLGPQGEFVGMSSFGASAPAGSGIQGLRYHDRCNCGRSQKGNSMKMAIAGDHAGFRLKQLLAERLQRGGVGSWTSGAHDESPSDYPDFARALGAALICRSGGTRHPGVRQRQSARVLRRTRSRASAPASAMIPTQRTRVWNTTT